MKKYCASITISILSALLTLPTAYAKDGIYVTLDTGFATQNGLPDSNQTQADSVENRWLPPAIRAAIGYNHDITPQFGVGFEAGPGYYGKTVYQFDSGSNTVTESTLEFLAVASWHVQRYDWIAKLGGLRITPNISGNNAPESDTQIRLEAALGAAYNITPHIAATLTFAHVLGDNISSFDEIGAKTPSLNEALVGMRYTFGYE